MIIFFVLSHAGVKNIVCCPEDFVTHNYVSRVLLYPGCTAL